MSEHKTQPNAEKTLDAARLVPEAEARVASERSAESSDAMREHARRKETGFARDARKAVSEWISMSGVNALPRWVRNGILMTRLFGIETAAAGDLIASPEEIPALDDVSRGKLAYLVEDRLEGTTVHYVENEMNLGENSDLIDWKRLESDEAIVFERQVGHMNFLRERPISEMPNIIETGWTFGSGTNNEIIAVRSWFDIFNNKISVIVMPGSDPGLCFQFVSIEPALGFARPGEEPELRSLNVDLMPIGGDMIIDALWYRQLPAVGMIGGNDVYARGIDAEDVRKILGQYGGDIALGSRQVDELFGDHPNANIVISSEKEANAHSNASSVILQAGLFEVEETGLAPRGKIVEEVTEHEHFHYRDWEHGLSKTPEMRLIFASASWDDLRELNESLFMGLGFGGHAQDNEREFVATILNTIDMADWDSAVPKLTRGARDIYQRGLQAAHDKIVRNSLAWGRENPPIVALLEKRISSLRLLAVPNVSP